jgi:hypothetical protein
MGYFVFHELGCGHFITCHENVMLMTYFVFCELGHEHFTTCHENVFCFFQWNSLAFEMGLNRQGLWQV